MNLTLTDDEYKRLLDLVGSAKYDVVIHRVYKNLVNLPVQAEIDRLTNKISNLDKRIGKLSESASRAEKEIAQKKKELF